MIVTMLAKWRHAPWERVIEYPNKVSPENPFLSHTKHTSHDRNNEGKNGDMHLGTDTLIYFLSLLLRIVNVVSGTRCTTKCLLL